jgi:hypothetical protein
VSSVVGLINKVGMEHHAPHKNSAFEGYYNKFSLPSGGHLVLVMCKVSRAQCRANLTTLTYVPRDGSGPYQKVIATDDIQMRKTAEGSNAFILEIPGLGYAEWKADASSEFHLQDESFTFHASARPGIPWSERTKTPEGLFIHFPLPLHWHVQSLSSPCKFNLNISGYDLPQSDTSGEATIHQEKNWATSFPSAHIWVQCREGDRGFCCAGGKIVEMEAFLFGYRSPDLDLDFRPPFALRFLGIGPFMWYKTNWAKRTFQLSVQSFRQKIEVHAQAPKGSFFPLSAPFAEGHRSNFLGQSVHARIEVKIYQSGWIGPWRLVREDIFERGSLEFGGAFYPPAGSNNQFN